MTAWERAHRLPLGAELPLTFATGAGTFALAAVALTGIDTNMGFAFLVLVYLVAVVAIAWLASIAYAVPVAMAGLLAYDWYRVPPTHPLEFPASDDLVELIVYLGVAVLVGQLAAHAARRAVAAERARAQIADEQAALRRVATLVAQAVPTSEIFEAVTREVGLQCDADLARMERFEPDHAVTALAAWSRSGDAQLAVGTRFDLDGASIAVQVYETCRPARVETFVGASGPIAREAQALGIRSSVGCPIIVDGRPWGVIAASTTRDSPFPPHTESRIAKFTDLAAAAISNAEARADLVASRARLLTANDDARRRVVRDLHDGAQHSLVQMILTLRRAQEQDDDEASRALVGEALDQAERANAELRELAHGILPPTLTEGGLAAGVKALVRRLCVPVSVDLPRDRFDPEVEASAYFVVAEALTNIAKHAGAHRADVTATVENSVLNVDVRDDGVGGARPDGTGLLGLNDRVAALGGRLRIESQPGHGTRIAATLPLHPERRHRTSPH